MVKMVTTETRDKLQAVKDWIEENEFDARLADILVIVDAKLSEIKELETTALEAVGFLTEMKEHIVKLDLLLSFLNKKIKD